MILKNKAKIRKKNQQIDPEKIKLIKSLVEDLQKSGLEVRREELKRGPGWKAKSGECVINGAKKTIFVDTRLSQNEQIEFLNSQLAVIKDLAINDSSEAS